LSFFFPEHEIFVGQWQVLDIGLDPDFSVETESMVQLLEEKDIQNLFIPRSRYAHKGMNGHLLLVAGSYGKIGASVLTARSALRAGCGLVTAYVPNCGYQILQTAVPEAMVITDTAEHIITRLPEQKDYACIALGPGLGTQPATASVVANLINSATCPMVIDADALNIIAADPSLISSVPKHSILTPHPGEFRRLAGSWKNDREKFELLIGLAKKIESIIVLKGAYTMIALPDGSVFINHTGNAYMATGGCGDALTGVIAAFVCQGYEPTEAAKLGVWLHGLAGDIASKGRYPILAGDLINKLPKAWNRIFGHKTANSKL
jgi:NAD(P)H-hydrate epimerase